MIPIFYEERSTIMLKSILGNATLVGVDFSDSFFDDGKTFVHVMYSLLEDKYDIHHFYTGYWPKSYIEDLLK